MSPEAVGGLALIAIIVALASSAVLIVTIKIILIKWFVSSMTRWILEARKAWNAKQLES